MHIAWLPVYQDITKLCKCKENRNAEIQKDTNYFKLLLRYQLQIVNCTSGKLIITGFANEVMQCKFITQ